MNSLKSREDIVIGRAPECDLVLSWPQVSRKHARIFRSDSKVKIEDLGSKNGTYIGDVSHRLLPGVPQLLKPSDIVFLGPYKLNLSLLANFGFTEFGGKGTDPSESPKSLSLKTTMSIGRAPDNDVVISYPQVSAYHAKITLSARGYLIEDLGSTNGTFVNGERIKQAIVKDDDIIGIGPYIFRIGADGCLYQEDQRGGMRLDAKGICVVIKDGNNKKTLLDDIDLSIYPREFVGLLGPAGAGKTTLLMALNGFLYPHMGQVLINGFDLYKYYDCFRGVIGYVTQDDILYKQLTVREALYYTARLRLPPDISDDEIMTNIMHILKELRMADKIDTIIGTPEQKVLSGGQRKRVNLAQELITQPSILFLDEPTSGLSSLDAEEVMDTLVRLAHSGRTIILTIHQPSLKNYMKMSHVIYLAEGGKLAYFGPTNPDSFTFFGVEDEKDPDLIIKNLMTGKPNQWKEKYKKSEYYEKFVANRHNTPLHLTTSTTNETAPLKIHFWHQLKILTTRYFKVKRKDTINTLILLLQAPIIGGLISWVFQYVENILKPLFLLSIVAIWFGCSNSAREIVSEQAIYRRERMVNLLIPTYILSKLIVLTLLCVIQCAILLGMARFFIDFKGDIITTYMILLLTSIGGLATGLTVSAFVKSQEAAISLVPILLIPQVILGGLLVKLPSHKDIEIFSHLIIAKWSFEGLLTIESKKQDDTFSILVQQSIGLPTDRLGADIFVLVAYFLIMVFFTAWLLKRKERVNGI